MVGGSFRKRHPEFILRIPAPVSQVWSKATDPDAFSRYFDLLEDTMKENDLDGRLGQIFNMDESGMPLDPKSPRLVFEKGCHASCVTTGDKPKLSLWCNRLFYGTYGDMGSPIIVSRTYYWRNAWYHLWTFKKGVD